MFIFASHGTVAGGRAITRRDALAFVQDVCALRWRTAAHDRRLMSDSTQRFVWTAQFGFYASHGHWTRIARYSFSDSNVEPQRGAREAVPGACRLRGLRLVSRELPPGVPKHRVHPLQWVGLALRGYRPATTSE